ncbi:unnamed protein product [Absidia cylindrospora]
MSLIPKEYQEYLLPQKKYGQNLKYFNDNPAKLWGMKECMEHHSVKRTHLTKSNLKAIMHQYHLALEKLSVISDLPAPVSEYIKNLLKEKHTATVFGCSATVIGCTC